MVNIVLFGAPGCGKGTQAQRLKEHYGIDHVSTGEVIRDEIRRGTELGQSMEAYIKAGQLAPDEIVIGMIDHYVTGHMNAAGCIFDGFPRTIEQADALNEMLHRRGSKVHAVVGLEVEDEELIDRLLKRGQESGRSDDNLETINERLKVYNKQTAPLRDYYIKQGKYHGIKGVGSIDDIFHSIKLNLKGTQD